MTSLFAVVVAVVLASSHVVPDLRARAQTMAGKGQSGLAQTLVDLAVAEAEAGENENAVWDWQIAQNLDPSLRAADLALYGAAGELLAKHRLPPTPAQCASPVSPEVTKRVEPRYPNAALQSRGSVIVELTVDAEGRPQRPIVLKSPHPSLTYATLVALKDWRFAPPQDAAAEPARFCRIFDFH